MSQKSISEVVFFYKEVRAGVEIPKFFEIPYHNGKPVYKSWPRLPHHDRDTVKYWGYRGDLFETKEVTMPNEFSPQSIVILDHVNTRHYSAKVPQAAIYSKEADCYLQFDFRAEGLIELMCDFSVEKGAPGCNMSFMYKGSNYYFVPTEGSFQEYKKSFEVSTRPKTKQTTTVGIDVPFVGSFDRVYRYLGAFKCTQDDAYDPGGSTGERINYSGKTVHVYHECQDPGYQFRRDREIENPAFCVSKSKMNVKSLEIPNECNLFETPDKGVVSTECGSKGSYGVGPFINCEVDFENHTVKYVKNVPAQRPGFCRPLFG